MQEFKPAGRCRIRPSPPAERTQGTELICYEFTLTLPQLDRTWDAQAHSKNKCLKRLMRSLL